jgi:hypothetical protein
VLDGRVIDELERIWKEAAMAYPRYYPEIFLGWLRKTRKNLSQDFRFPGRDLNRTLPEYSAERYLYTDPFGESYTNIGFL